MNTVPDGHIVYPQAVVVDDHELIAFAVSAALTAHGMTCTHVRVRPGADLVADVVRLRPELVLLDLDLGSWGDSTRLIAPLTAAGIKVLMVTGVVDRDRVAAALEQGAIGYRAKGVGFDALVQGARAALDGTVPLDPAERHTLLSDLARSRAEHDRRLAPFRSLTERERATLGELARGLTVTDIARSWVVSEATVRTHVRGVLSKLGASSQLAAVAAALQNGWLDAVQPTGAGAQRSA